MSAVAASSRVAVRKDNPLCGDEIDLTVDVADGRIGPVSHRARACSFVRASATLLETAAPGRTLEDARELAERVDRALRGADTLPDGFERLAPALLMPSRRTCVLLPWRALIDALELPG
jgi:nitrogen fixation NifU-like protein